MDDDITSKVLKFADDTKVFRKIKTCEIVGTKLHFSATKLSIWHPTTYPQFIVFLNNYMYSVQGDGDYRFSHVWKHLSANNVILHH